MVVHVFSQANLWWIFCLSFEIRGWLEYVHYKVCFKGFRLLLSSEVSDAGLLEDNQWSDITPRKINIEPGNDGLVQMIFLFQGAHILRFQPLIFQLCTSVLWQCCYKLRGVFDSIRQLVGASFETLWRSHQGSDGNPDVMAKTWNFGVTLLKKSRAIFW